MPLNKREFARLARCAARFSLDYHVVGPGIVTQITFIDAQEKHSVTLGDKIAPGSYQNEIVVVVSDDGDQGAGWVAS
jgi:hypothetical protein